ncbi:Zinc finger, MYND-type [Penicillium italicum]|uniref:Zinc finger, MYND-type n=1 Tax=Penicillium italicum TaxID=40296 RepID=A0A0A2L5K4_PENIT|nr:Zinc finger, MYND-type [Penicillium italicum]
MPPPIAIEQPEFLRQKPVQPKTALPWGCAICDTKEDLKTCTACGVLSYCSRDHQIEHRKAHKELCNYVKQTRAAVEDTHARLGPSPHDPSLPNVRRLLTERQFEADRKKYFVASFNLQECMERVYTERSVRAALEMSKLARLYLPDNYLACGLVSALWIRLDEDEEVYGFIKSWYLWEESENHPPGQMAPTPIKNPDILEDVDFFLGVEARFMDGTDTVTFLLSLTLLKIKILLDLKDLHQARQVIGPKVPQEVLDEILAKIPRSSSIKANRRIMRNPDLSAEIAKLDTQVDSLYKKIRQTNFFWWRTLVDRPLDAINTVVTRSHGGAPAEYGSPLEAAIWLTQKTQRFCWNETPGALDFLREKNSNFTLPRLSETHRVYGRGADELVSALYNSQ